MRKRTIIKIGRRELTSREESGDPQDAKRRAPEVPKELALRTGKLAIGRRQISNEHFPGTGSYIVGGHAASYLVTPRVVTDKEALAAFDRKQHDDATMAAVGASAVGLIAIGITMALSQQHPSHEDIDRHDHPATATPQTNHTGDPAGIQSMLPEHEQVPFNTTTPIPPPTSFVYRR